MYTGWVCFRVLGVVNQSKHRPHHDLCSPVYICR